MIRQVNRVVLDSSFSNFVLQGVMSGLVGADNRFGRDFNSPNATTQGTIVGFVSFLWTLCWKRPCIGCHIRTCEQRHVSSMAYSTLDQDIGCAIGSLFVLFFGESIGRKKMIMAGATTMLVGTVRWSSIVSRCLLKSNRQFWRVRRHWPNFMLVVL